MSNFQVVPDELRTTTERTHGGRGQPPKPEWDAMEAGKTVFFPMNGTDRHKLANKIRSAMAYRKKVATVRSVTITLDGTDVGVEGVLAWITGERAK